VLEEIIMTRSYNCELIVFAANEGGTLMAANSIYNMHRFGWDHYLLIVSSEAQCKKLRESPLQISCAWTTFLKDHKASALTRASPDAFFTVHRPLPLAYLHRYLSGCVASRAT